MANLFPAIYHARLLLDFQDSCAQFNAELCQILVLHWCLGCIGYR